MSILDGRGESAHLLSFRQPLCGEAGIVTMRSPPQIRNSSFRPINLSENVLHVKKSTQKVVFVGHGLIKYSNLLCTVENWNSAYLMLVA